ncbi:hypothetical protein [Bacillus benzoevorans]|nr:hypothetical protein [Bacillus benzoevorans]
MMEANRYVHGENMKLLKEIYNLKTKQNDMYIQSGPNSSDYINLSIQLNVLEKKYMEEKLSMYQEELVNTRTPHENLQPKFIGKYQKFNHLGEQSRKSPVWHVLVQF